MILMARQRGAAYGQHSQRETQTLAAAQTETGFVGVAAAYIYYTPMEHTRQSPRAMGSLNTNDNDSALRFKSPHDHEPHIAGAAWCQCTVAKG